MKIQQKWGRQLQALALAAGAVAIVAVSAGARQTDQPGRPERMRGPMPFAHLNLTTEQQERVKSILEEQRSASQDQRNALRAAHDDLQKAIFGAAAPDSGKIDALVGRISELEADALRARVATQVKLATILTPEQRQQLATMKPPRGGGPGRRPGGPGR